MESAPTLQNQTSGMPEATLTRSPLRMCLVTREELPKDALVRFVVGPDHSIVADLSCNLPGRGLWVKSTREAITTAAQKNLFAKAAKTSVTVDKNLADQVEAL